MEILVLSEQDIKQIFTMKEAIAACKEAMILYSKGAAHIPLRANLPVPEHHGESLYMYGYVPDAQALGVKLVSVYPGNVSRGIPSVPATMVLLDAATGAVAALLDGTWLTRLRTGAVAGAATDFLARKDSQTFTLFGTGGQAETQLEAVLTVRNIKQVNVFDIDAKRCEDFVHHMQQQFGESFKVVIKAAQSSSDAVIGADIITSVTTSKRPVFNGELVAEGTHVNGVGSFTPDMQEIDSTVLERAARIYVDTRDGALQESGDFLIPLQKKVFSLSSVTGELGEGLAGKTPGRDSAKEITFFKTTGSAILDLVTAQKIYQAAVAAGLGQKINF